MSSADGLQRLQAVLWQRAGRAVPDEGVLVTIDEFFAGNDNVGSIAPNLVEHDPDPVMRHPGLGAVRRRLEEVEARTDVDAVLVDVMVEWEEYPPGDWPHAQGVHVITTATPEAVDSWIDGLNAEPCGVAPDRDLWVNPPIVPAGFSIVTIWWD